MTYLFSYVHALLYSYINSNTIVDEPCMAILLGGSFSALFPCKMWSFILPRYQAKCPKLKILILKYNMFAIMHVAS